MPLDGSQGAQRALAEDIVPLSQIDVVWHRELSEGVPVPSLPRNTAPLQMRGKAKRDFVGQVEPREEKDRTDTLAP